MSATPLPLQFASIALLFPPVDVTRVSAQVAVYKTMFDQVDGSIRSGSVGQLPAVLIGINPIVDAWQTPKKDRVIIVHIGYAIVNKERNPLRFMDLLGPIASQSRQMLVKMRRPGWTQVGYCGDSGFVEKAYKETKPPVYSTVPALIPRDEYTWFDPDRMELPSSGMYSAFPEEKITLHS